MRRKGLVVWWLRRVVTSKPPCSASLSQTLHHMFAVFGTSRLDLQTTVQSTASDYDCDIQTGRTTSRRGHALHLLVVACPNAQSHVAQPTPQPAFTSQPVPDVPDVSLYQSINQSHRRLPRAFCHCHSPSRISTSASRPVTADESITGYKSTRQSNTLPSLTSRA